MTHKSTQVFLCSYYIDLSLVVGELSDVYEGRTHGSVVRFDFFGRVCLLCINHGHCVPISSGGRPRNASKQLFLSLQRLVSLPLPELLEPIADYHLVKSLQLCLPKEVSLRNFSDCGPLSPWPSKQATSSTSLPSNPCRWAPRWRVSPVLASATQRGVRMTFPSGAQLCQLPLLLLLPLQGACWP